MDGLDRTAHTSFVRVMCDVALARSRYFLFDPRFNFRRNHRDREKKKGETKKLLFWLLHTIFCAKKIEYRIVIFVRESFVRKTR